MYPRTSRPLLIHANWEASAGRRSKSLGAQRPDAAADPVHRGTHCLRLGASSSSDGVRLRADGKLYHTRSNGTWRPRAAPEAPKRRRILRHPTPGRPGVTLGNESDGMGRSGPWSCPSRALRRSNVCHPPAVRGPRAVGVVLPFASSARGAVSAPRRPAVPGGSWAVSATNVGWEPLLLVVQSLTRTSPEGPRARRRPWRAGRRRKAEMAPNTGESRLGPPIPPSGVAFAESRCVVAWCASGRLLRQRRTPQPPDVAQARRGRAGDSIGSALPGPPPPERRSTRTRPVLAAEAPVDEVALDASSYQGESRRPRVPGQAAIATPQGW